MYSYFSKSRNTSLKSFVFKCLVSISTSSTIRGNTVTSASVVSVVSGHEDTNKQLQTALVMSCRCSLASYFSCLGSQSSPGSSCRAVCLTSSLSTNRLRRCSACTTATLIHSMRGGRSRKGLQGGSDAVSAGEAPLSLVLFTFTVISC